MVKIIIADDHDVVRKGLKQIISEELPEATIVLVPDGNTLMKSIRADLFDIVISDISMPGLSGIELLKQLKEEHPKLPVLILSMHPEDQYAIRVLKAGAAGYMTKNSVSEELIKGILQILNGKRYVSANLAEILAQTLDQDARKEPHESLSNREFDVLKYIASGKTVSGIAEELSLSIPTVSTYRARIMEKMNMKTNAELTNYAIRNNLV